MRYFVILLVIFLGSGCKDWEFPQSFPIVVTEGVINVSPKGAEFVGRVESLGSDHTVIEYGFVWSESQMPTINSSRVVISNPISQGVFSQMVSNDLISGNVYFVRSFIKTNKVLVYGNQLRFISQGSMAPKIVDFEPKEGVDGEIITINGQNFSSRVDGNTVKVGSIVCEVLSASETQLKVKLANSIFIGEYKISITGTGGVGVSSNEFSILGPRINSISKTSGRVGDMITINGKYFKTTKDMSVYFGELIFGVPNYSYPYVISDTEIECYVPDIPISGGQIRIYSYPNLIEKKFVFPDNFLIDNSWDKLNITTPLPGYLGNMRYSTSVIGNSIFVVAGNMLYEFNSIELTWSKKKDFPGEKRYFGSSFVFNGEIYFGFGESGYVKYFNDLWKYNPVTDEWIFLENAPFEPRSGMTQFVIGNSAYLGFGWDSSETFRELWSYNMETAAWNQINVPVEINSDYLRSVTSFSLKNKGYIVGLNAGIEYPIYRSLWEFDPAIPSWTRKEDFPNQLSSETTSTTSNHGFVINHVSGSIYEYDDELNRWIMRQSLRMDRPQTVFSQFVNEGIYYSTGAVWKLSFN